VFKIEGRGRAPEYVEIVTRAYKQALQDVQNGTYTKEKIEEYFEALKTVYNRDQSHGNYYLGQELDAYSDTHGSKATMEKTAAGVVQGYFAKVGVAEILLNADALSIGDEIKIIGRTTGVYSTTITELRDVNKNPITEAKKGDIVTIPVTRRVRENDQVYLWKER